MTTLENVEQKYCQWCGNEGSDPHHLFRRGVAPELKDAPENIMILCRKCHDFATKSASFEKLLQEKFFLKEEKELDLKIIETAMKSQAPMSPREVVNYRKFLAGEYSFLAGRMEEVEQIKPDAWNDIRFNREGVKSDKQAERIWEATPEGKTETFLKTRLKRIQKMLSALSSIFELKVAESRNQM